VHFPANAHPNTPWELPWSRLKVHALPIIVTGGLDDRSNTHH
jgi:hypothetical protein